MNITPLQTAILTALARYRFLTNSQFATLRIGHLKSIQAATRLLSSEGKKPLLKVQKFPIHARFGKLEYVYRLSKTGAHRYAEIKLLSELPEIPRSGMYGLDFFHRKTVIDFCIFIDQILVPTKIRLIRWENYFDKTGANHSNRSGPPLMSRTRVPFTNGKFFIPDSILVLRFGKHKALFALEVVRGNKKGRTLWQVSRHMKAMAEGAVTEKYQVPEGQDYVALFLFEDNRLRHRVMAALETGSGFTPFREHFLFADVTDSRRHVRGCWRKIGDTDYLYDFIDGRKAHRLRDPP